MPVRPTYPGVYIEEVSSGVRTIVGVSTSVAAFVDSFARGPLNLPIQIFSVADFEREFGGLDAVSQASYGIQQFFLNGGSEAFVVRAGGATAAAIELQDAGAATVLTVTAGRQWKGVSVEDPGGWGNFVRLDVDYETTDPATLFNLTVSEVGRAGAQPVLRTETFRNLSMTSTAVNFVDSVVNEGSRIVQVVANGANRPIPTGTFGAALVPATVAAIAAAATLNVSVAGGANVQVTITDAPAAPPGTPAADVNDAILRDARRLLEAGIRAADPNDPRLSNATVQLLGRGITAQLRVLSGRAGDPATSGSAFDPLTTLVFTEDGGSTAADLGLLNAATTENVQQYTLGGATAGFQDNAVVGVDSIAPTALELMGVRANKTGLFALEDVDIFNILCLPAAAELAAPEPFQVYSAAEAYCLERRAFLIVDIPSTVDQVQDMKDWMESNSGLRNRNAAVYFPRLRIGDPLNQFRLGNFAPSGTMAGLYARTDNERGVWKAPAGIEATLRNVNELDDVLTDPENGTLNPLGINCLRTFPVIGTVSWGGRTLDGADVQSSEWKYLPVRRFALFLEESLYRGTKFAVFEPNDEPLWSQIRLNIGAFLQTLFRQGAFQGQTPRDAYFVRCDKDTTTQNDINLGIVNVLVGFAPLKPAEFVILKISQIAGQIQV
jgi:phage tail sheath protein FI